MPLTIAPATYLCLASGTFPVVAPISASRNGINEDPTWFDPHPATFGRTVDSILRLIFLVLPVPFDLELRIKQLLNMLERDVIRRTALRRHVLWISQGHGEYSFQAIMAQMMRASKLRRFAHWNVI